MTALNIKKSAVNLINQIDDSDTKLLEKVWMFLSTNIQPPKSTEKKELTASQKYRLAEVEELCGAFSACQTEDWKKDKEEYLLEKYGVK